MDSCVKPLDELSSKIKGSFPLGAGTSEEHSVCRGLWAPQGSSRSPRRAARFAQTHFQRCMESRSLVWLCYGRLEWVWRFLVWIRASGLLFAAHKQMGSCTILKNLSLFQHVHSFMWLYLSIVTFLVRSILLYFLPYKCISFHTCS